MNGYTVVQSKILSYWGLCLLTFVLTWIVMTILSAIATYFSRWVWTGMDPAISAIFFTWVFLALGTVGWFMWEYYRPIEGG